MLVIAHRGANKEALENSWMAFDKAVECGAARIELDVQLARDGSAVVMHDDSVLRTTGVDARISQMDRSELRRLKLKNGEPIPFLDEVVERLLPRIELNVEVKGRAESLAKAVCDLVGTHKLRDKVIVSCFHPEPLKWIARHHPDLQRACLWGSDTLEWPFFSIMTPSVFLSQCQTNILHPHTSLVDGNLMDQAEARGWRVYAWAEMVGEERDREGTWTALKTVGLHGLCTNYPRQLGQWLEEARQDEQRVWRRG